MSRNLLKSAANEVDTAKEATSHTETSDRLETLANKLRSQAERDSTPALGTLDRVHTKLRRIEDQTDDATIRETIESAREDIMDFLETLDDRGMQQHGWGEENA